MARAGWAPVQLELDSRELIPGLVVSRLLAGYLVHLQNEDEFYEYNL